MNGQIVDNCEPGTQAPIDPTCNGIDDDCDGEVDEDYSMTQSFCGIGACQSTGYEICEGGKTVSTCVPGSPAPLEICGNGLDDDCDGEVDEGCANAVIPTGDRGRPGNLSGTIHIYPNPTSELINIGVHMEHNTINKIHLVNGLGQATQLTMLPLSKGHMAVDVSEFQAGLYFLHITSDEFKVIKPIAIK